ncbi:hypothetical protein SAMN05421821_101353 [Mucilaginibacter lappiensis]|uniref:Uncharacterized protein n=1 Tax=Mucilaginibacter lappiensis TaxID=354630 RepID=A0ABR6PHP2_9SPHI|nr:hypothetical protein [Mucilaginibacter lappiensis]MBB6107731.1 hypothetical protein [Mucilaginibacter lappiensis]SIP98898.1 hypothetical protein SAMN05421821_101353 [Mucilaginibacter lappiensis]
MENWLEQKNVTVMIELAKGNNKKFDYDLDMQLSGLSLTGRSTI